MGVRFLTLLLAFGPAVLFGQTQLPPPHFTHSAKPDFPPSYTLHVSPSQTKGTAQNAGMDFLSLQGFDLKGVISLLYNLNRIRIEIPASLDDGNHYDFSMILPKPEDQEQLNNRLRQGILDYFQLVAAFENRSIGVYVVSVQDRQPPLAKPLPTEGGMIQSASIDFQSRDSAGNPRELAAAPEALSISAIDGISVEGTADEFCHLLESELDRPVVNETKLIGRFAFDVQTDQRANDEFLDQLHRQLGIVVTPAERNVEILSLKPR
jgi:uncharacterized protein (TIGR03435 family)